MLSAYLADRCVKRNIIPYEKREICRVDSGDTEAVYTYNANNLRASKTVNRSYTSFVWNGQNLVSETTNGSVDTYTYDGTGVHIVNQAGTVAAYLKDFHGNIVGKTDTDGEMLNELTNRMDYDAFGNQWIGDTPDPFGYCGEYLDSESGLIYLRNRYYDTQSGRFITEDPVKDGLNWYSYCGGNPVNAWDPSGLKITASVAESNTVLEPLQALTDDEIVFEEEFDENGVSTGMGHFVIKKSYDTDRHVGQTLITDLINSAMETNINIGIDPSATSDDLQTNKFTGNAEGTLVTIWIDPETCKNTYAYMMDMDTGEITMIVFDDFMVLGHELVHAWRVDNGMYLPYADEGGPSDAEYRYGFARQEELQTTGLFYKAEGHTNPQSMHGIMSENGLRLENQGRAYG